VSVGTGPVGGSPGDTSYDITVIGPNRFLRRYIGDTEAAGADVWVEATYYDRDQHGHDCDARDAQPKLKLLLRNDGKKAVTFTITFNNYCSRSHESVKVKAHGREEWTLDACRDADGWYDLTVTVSNDSSWSQRLTGHVETGRASVSG
jgi:phospholipase C